MEIHNDYRGGVNARPTPPADDAIGAVAHQPAWPDRRRTLLLLTDSVESSCVWPVGVFCGRRCTTCIHQRVRVDVVC